MKKIAIDARNLLLMQRGMPLYVAMLCKHLPPLMPDVQFLVLINKEFPPNRPAEKYQPLIDEIAKHENVRIENISAKTLVEWELLRLPQALRRLKPDLLHMPANRVCLTTRVPQIATFHDIMEWHYLREFYPIPKQGGLKLKFYFLRLRLYVWLQFVLGLRRTRRIISISEYASRTLINLFPFVESRTTWVYHGVPEGFVEDPQFNTINSRKGILMLGGDSYQKNPENAILAWSQLSDHLRERFPLTVAGFTGEETSPLLRAIRECGVENEVIIKTWVEPEELVQLFQQSALFLFASREEGFGFPLLQALACGTPAVTSTATVLLEIGGNAILSAPAEKPVELSVQIQKVLESEEIWNELHIKALNVAKTFDWSAALAHVKQVYTEVLND